MQLKSVLSPVNGLFTNMPQTIWGPDFDPTLVDIELFTRIGGLEASPMVEHFTVGGVLDVDALSTLLFQKYGKNWKRIWDALIAEYDIMLTNMMDEKRTSTRDITGKETRDLKEKASEIAERINSNSLSNVKTGSIDRTGNVETEYGTTDLETRNIIDTTTEGGTEALTDTFNEHDNRTSTLTYSGAENRTGSDNETRNLTSTDTGTVGTTANGSQGGNGGTVTDHGVYGVGGAGLANESRESAQETRNFTDSNSSTETRNLTGTDSGTSNHAKTDNLSFVGRNDKTVESNDHTGTVKHETDFGKTEEVKGTGTVTGKKTGTDTVGETAKELYNAVTDAQTGNAKDNDTLDAEKLLTGDVDNTQKDEFKEEFHSEGSSPLRTFQALIQEEIDGRSGSAWNFTDIVIRDVQTMIASKIWRRTHGAL